MTSQCRAPLWRITLVAPSRTAQASTASTSGSSATGDALERGVDPGRRQRHPRALQLTVERRLAVAADRLAHLAERLAGDLLHVGDLGRRPVGAVGQQPAGELGLDRDHRQRVAEQVVQVTGEALALGGDRGAGQLGAGLAELLIAHPQIAQQHQQQADADGAAP